MLLIKRQANHLTDSNVGRKPIRQNWLMIIRKKIRFKLFRLAKKKKKRVAEQPVLFYNYTVFSAEFEEKAME